MNSPRDDMRGRLEHLAGRVSDQWSAAQGREQFRSALGQFGYWFAAIPLLFVLPAAFRRWRGLEPGYLGTWPVLILAAALPMALVWYVARRRRQAPLRTAQALQHADQELGLADRLSTAWDFSARSQRGGFEQAAIEDAEHRIGQAELSNWTIADRESAFTGALGLWITCGLLALFLGWKVADWRPAAKENAVTAQALPGVGKAHTPVATGSGLSVPSSEPEVEVPVEPPADSPKGRAEKAKPAKPGDDNSDEVKQSQGVGGAGQSAAAMSTSAASQSRSAPSSQGQDSEQNENKTQKPETPRKPGAKAVPEPEKREKEEEDAGSTAGKGSSKGSNKNPTTSSWKSKDQVTNEDDQEIEDDEETEDDEEEQESRGGVQPHLRDRRPPVSRDLQIAFGNRPNPDANGRGGPSEQKKSRGVASLVLGVPIPDRVKGQPGKGPTKVTQERVQPQAESPETATAGARQPGATPAPLRHPQLDPWLRGIVRRYFLARRQMP